MKRSAEAQVSSEMDSRTGRPARAKASARGRKVAVAAAVALGLAAATPMAHAVSPVVQLKGDAWLSTLRDTGGTAATFHVETSFSTDTPGAQLFTIQRAVIYFPDHAGTNGALFKSCSGEQIERFNGNVNRCPKGSKIGSGTVRASALQLGITARGRVTMFNGPGGKSIVFNIQTNLPAYINESIDAPLTQLHGRYGEKLTLVVPHSLQEIISGVFVAVQEFDVELTGTTRVKGVDYSYLRARTCPKFPVHGDFDFKDWTTGQVATTTVDSRVTCKDRRTG
jgi:hypothetical protein